MQKSFRKIFILKDHQDEIQSMKENYEIKYNNIS